MPCHSYGTMKHNQPGDEAPGIMAHGYQTAANQYLPGFLPASCSLVL